MKYIRLYNIPSDYTNDINKDLYIPSISMVKGLKNFYYPNYPKYNLLDILYSDANGNLTISQEVLPASDNLTPIGICVIPTGFISTYSKARFISLKWMNNGTGSISVSGMNWGDVENLPLDIITYTFKNGEDNGFLTDYNPANKKTKLIPTLKTQDNKLDFDTLGDINQYAATAINGKENTKLVLETVTLIQEDWRTAQTLNTNYLNFPPFTSCARYQPLGTQQGDWYLPAIGELAIMMSNLTIINDKITEIHSIYNNITYSAISSTIWSSSIKTNVSNGLIWRIGCADGAIYNRSYNASGYVLAMLQI